MTFTSGPDRLAGSADWHIACGLETNTTISFWLASSIRFFVVRSLTAELTAEM